MKDTLNNLSARDTNIAVAICLAVFAIWLFTKDLMPAHMGNLANIITPTITFITAATLNAIIFVQLKRIGFLRDKEHPTLRFCLAAPSTFWAAAALLTLQGFVPAGPDTFLPPIFPHLIFWGMASLIWNVDFGE